MSSDLLVPYSNMAGILFSEDFDAPTPSEESSSEKDDIAEQGPPLIYTEDAHQEALRQAVAAATKEAEDRTRAIVEAEKSAAQEEENSKRILATQLAVQTISEGLNEKLDVYASAVSASLLEAFITAFPQWTETSAHLRPEGILNSVMPLFSGDFHVTIQIAPATYDLIRTRKELADLLDASWITFQTDEKAGPDDFLITWPEGRLSRRLEDITATLLSSIATTLKTSSSEQDSSR